MSEAKETDLLLWDYKDSTDNVHQYALSAGDTLLSVLRFEHKPEYDAIAQIGDTQLLFEKHSTAPYHILVRDVASKAQIARFDANMRGDGVLQLSEGRSLKWLHHNVFVPEWAFEDNEGTKIVDVKAKFGFGKPHSQVTTGIAGATEEVVVLATIGWYVILISNLYPSYMANR